MLVDREAITKYYGMSRSTLKQRIQDLEIKPVECRVFRNKHLYHSEEIGQKFGIPMNIKENSEKKLFLSDIDKILSSE